MTPFIGSSTLVLASGDFGGAVAVCLSRMIGARVADVLMPPEKWPEASFRVLVTGRRFLQVEAALEALSFERREAWLPIACRQPIVEFGPLVDPGFGPCFS